MADCDDSAALDAVDAAQSAGVKRLVYTSAPKATTSPLILAPEHKATEEYLAESGLVYTVVRHGWYTENYLQPATAGRSTRRPFNKIRAWSPRKEVFPQDCERAYRLGARPAAA